MNTSPKTSQDQLLRDFCQCMGLKGEGEADAVARGGTLDIHGVHLSLAVNRRQADAPMVSIYLDVGVPLRAGEAVLRVLLVQNHAHSADRGVAYCISPSGQVLGVLHVGLGGLDGPGLAALVEAQVDATLSLRHALRSVEPDSGP
jgi:hypothetical protein